jgi:hypothetical protein
MKKHVHVRRRVMTRICIHSAVLAIALLVGTIAEAASK